jgi:hypothetical protein
VYSARVAAQAALGSRSVFPNCLTFMVARHPSRVDAKRGDHLLQADIGTDSVESRFDHFRTSDHSSAISLTFYVLLSAKMSYFPFSLSGPLSP